MVISLTVNSVFKGEWVLTRSPVIMEKFKGVDILASMNTAAAAFKLGKPFADELGLDIWDVQFVKEGSNMVLRFIIDKPEGINIIDCENLSRAIDKPLDDADIVSCAYTLEVQSTGPERDISRPEHFMKMLGKKIKVKFIRPKENGEREFIGTLLSYDNGVSTLETDEGQIIFKKSETASIRLYDEDLFTIGGMKENE